LKDILAAMIRVLDAGKFFGLPFDKEINICIGGCVSQGDPRHYSYDTPSPYSAHTHVCPNEEFFKYICVWDESHIKNSAGEVTELLWHEYAHVLDIESYSSVPTNCGDSVYNHSMKITSSLANSHLIEDYAKSNGHGESWRKIMIEVLHKNPTLTVTIN
jgi:hypothetical protein